MNKFFIVLLLVVSTSLAALNPDIRTSQQGNVTHVYLAPAKLPDLKIQICSQCGKKALKTCQACQFTYYCSGKCQKLNKQKHTVICKEVGMALKGHLHHMSNVYAAFMAKAIEVRDKELVKQGVFWHCAILFRLRQDIACSKSLSVQSGIDKTRFENMQVIMHLIDVGLITHKEFQAWYKKSLIDAFKWVEDKTNKKELVSPVDVRRYSMEAFLSQDVDLDSEFIPEKDWHQKRVETLKRIREELKREGMMHSNSLKKCEKQV